MHEPERRVGPEAVDQADGTLERHRHDAETVQLRRHLLELAPKRRVALCRRRVHRGQIVDQIRSERPREASRPEAPVRVPA